MNYKLDLDKTELGLALIAVEEMIMQCEEADDTEIQCFGIEPSTRDGVLDTYTSIAVQLKVAIELESMEENLCSLCGNDVEELTQRADMTLGTNEPVWLCDDCNQ